MDLAYIVKFIMWAVTSFFLITLPYWLIVLCYQLGKRDYFFTIVEEGQAKTVKYNGKFVKAIMSFREYMFRKEKNLLPIEKRGRKKNETDEQLIERLDIGSWDIIPGEDIKWYWELPIIGNMIRGIRWIGFPPFAEIHKYRFNWTEAEYGQTKGGEGELTTRSRGEIITHILVQDYVYAIKLTSVETQDRLPVNISLRLTAYSVNPYKSLFKTHNWLTTIVNQMFGRVREFIGQETYDDLFQEKEAHSERLAKKMKTFLELFRKEYGIAVRLLQISDVDLVDKTHKELSTREYQAKREAELIDITSEAEEKKIDRTYGKMHRLAGVDGVKWYGIEKSKLRTYVEGGSKASITIPADTEEISDDMEEKS